MTQSPKHLDTTLQGKESNNIGCVEFVPTVKAAKNLKVNAYTVYLHLHFIYLKRNIIPCRIQLLQDGDLIKEFIKMLIFLYAF